MYRQKRKKVKSKAAMLLSKHNVPLSKEEEEVKADPRPKLEVKGERCPTPQQQDSPIKVEPQSPPKMDNRQVSTTSNDDLPPSHACDLLNSSMVPSLGDEANEYEEFPPTPLCEKGDVFASLAQAHDEYGEAAFATPPSEEGAANNQVFEDMPKRRLFLRRLRRLRRAVWETNLICGAF